MGGSIMNESITKAAGASHGQVIAVHYIASGVSNFAKGGL